MQFFNVKNWDDLQHYKDRAPPWIKLYNHLLDDYEFACLQDASKLHLMLIWLLASRNSNKLPFNARWIKQRIGVAGDVDLMSLVEAGFLEPDPSNDGPLKPPENNASNVLADCKQVATTEESRGEGEESRGRADISAVEATEKTKKPAKKKPPSNPETAEIWESYSDAYFNRYGTDPIRNVKVNSTIKQIHQRLGADSKHVAAYYVSINDQYLIKQSHNIGALLQNCEGYRTQWATGQQITTERARQIDRSQTNLNAAQEANRLRRQERDD